MLLFAYSVSVTIGHDSDNDSKKDNHSTSCKTLMRTLTNADKNITNT